MKSPSRRTLLIGGIVGAIVVGGAAIATYAAVTSTPTAATPTPSVTATPTPSPTPTPTPTPTPMPTTFPASAPVMGSIDGWTTAGSLVVANVLPQVGEAAEGQVSAYINAPVVDADVAVLETDVSVEPGKTYDVSFQVRAESLEPVTPPVVVQAGGVRVPLPELHAWWQPAETTFVADGPTAHIAVVLQGPVTGLGIDSVVVSESGVPDAPNLVPNPSFEGVSTDERIVNRSLVFPSERAVLAVTGAEGPANWLVADSAGNQVASGVQNLAGSVTAVPLTGVTQGYYLASVTDAAGTTTDFNIAVLDMPNGSMPLDQRFGVGLHVENEYYADAAELTASLGIGLARNDILWERNELTRGVYDWQWYYRDGFRALHTQGIHLLGIVNYGNALYGSKKVPDNPEAMAAYGRYAAAIAGEFDLVGLEVFNEFNHTRFNTAGCGTDPTCYIPMLQTVRDAAHAVDPDLPIVAGSTANYEGEWFDALWHAGGLPLSDAVSYHPYQVVAAPEKIGGIVRESYDHMQQIAGDTRPVWITELGMTSTPAGLTLEGQADFALRATLSALEAGVEKYFWYDLINDSTDYADHEGNFGLFFRYHNGVAALPPKPAAYAYGLMISQLSGYELSGVDDPSDAVMAVPFSAPDGSTVHAAWAPSGSGEAEIASTGPVRVVTFDGKTTVLNQVDGFVSVPVTSMPVFVHVDAADGSTEAPADGSTEGSTESPAPDATDEATPAP